MTISDEINIIFGPPANPCVYHSISSDLQPHQCYSEFSLNDELYKVDDIVAFKNKKKKEVGKLKCMFMTEDGTFHVAFEKGVFEKKLILITDITSILEKQNMESADLYFDADEHLQSTELTEIICNSPLGKFESPSSNQTPLLYSTPVDGKDAKETNTDTHSVTTPRKNSVKRNLNKSFGDVHNYSIVESVKENPLKVKLRKSKNLKMIENEDSPSLRKSMRKIPRKSYAEYISPLKTEKELLDALYSPKFSERTNKVVRSLYANRETPKTDATDTPRRLRKRVNDVEKTPTIDSPIALRSKRPISYCEFQIDEDDLCSPIGNNLNESLRTATLRINIDKLNIQASQQKTTEDNNKEDYQISYEPERSSPRTAHNLHESFPNNLIVNLEKYDIKDQTTKSTIDNSTPRMRRNRMASLSNGNDEPCPKTPPRMRRNRVASMSDGYDEPVPKTPRSKRNNKTVIKANNVTKTPGNRAKLIRDGLITPSMQQRSKAVEGDSTPLMKARSQLHVSYVPKTLPCREKEYADLYGFLHGKLQDGCGGCMYVSGVPGTGKTATVSSVITSLQENKAVPNFTFININGMKLTEPRQSYVEILKQLTGKSVPWEQAQSMLEDIFVKSKKQKPVVMLIDELDILCTKRQDVVYNLLDWPTKAKNQLIVITIANTMDLPERLLMSRVTSRLGLTRLTFQAYTYKQLQEIVTMRLTGTNTFNPDAVQFVARKVASVSGDARRALDICRRAAEIAEAEGKIELVNMTHVNEALNLMITQPKVQAIRHCSLLEQLILQSIVGEVERTGVEETNFSAVYRMLASHAAIEGFKMVSTTITLTAVARLGACRLILTDPKCNNIHQRIVLNVSADDVFYALKNK